MVLPVAGGNAADRDLQQGIGEHVGNSDARTVIAEGGRAIALGADQIALNDGVGVANVDAARVIARYHVAVAGVEPPMLMVVAVGSSASLWSPTMSMPKKALPRSSVPVISVPMELPCTVVFVLA